MKTTVGELRRRASEALDICTLQDIRLLGASCTSSNPITVGPLVVNTQVQVKGEDRPEGEVHSFARYRLSATLDAEEPAPAWTVEIELVAVYAKGSEAKLSHDQVSAFALAIGVMNIHPYARETAQSLVSRMGYPPFTMDLIMPLTSGPDDQEIELEPDGDGASERIDVGDANSGR